MIIIWSSFSFYIGYGIISVILKIVGYFLIYYKIEPRRCFSLQLIEIVKGFVLVVLVVGEMKKNTWNIEFIYYFGFL
jgi:hypothetical protein